MRQAAFLRGRGAAFLREGGLLSFGKAGALNCSVQHTRKVSGIVVHTAVPLLPWEGQANLNGSETWAIPRVDSRLLRSMGLKLMSFSRNPWYRMPAPFQHAICHPPSNENNASHTPAAVLR